MLRYKFCIVTGGDLWVTIQGAAALRYCKMRARHGLNTASARYDTTHNARGMGLLCRDTIFLYHDRGAATRRMCARGDMEGGACDTSGGGPRYGALHSMTRSPARGLGAMREQRARTGFLGCAHCAPNPVLTQCTVYSHCLENVHGHCS